MEDHPKTAGGEPEIISLKDDKGQLYSQVKHSSLKYDQQTKHILHPSCVSLSVSLSFPIDELKDNKTTTMVKISQHTHHIAVKFYINNLCKREL